MTDYDLWVSKGGFPEFYRLVIKRALESPYLVPSFKEVYEHLEDFYLNALRNREVDKRERLTSAVDLGFHQLKDLKEVSNTSVKNYLEHQRTLKSLTEDLLKTLNYEL